MKESKKLDPKQIYESMTVWFNSVLFILPDLIWILDEVVKSDIIMVPQYVNAIVKVIAIFNIVLRLKTKQPIQLPK